MTILELISANRVPAKTESFEDLLTRDGLLGELKDKMYPGSDGMVRLATIRTMISQLRRSISKICPLSAMGIGVIKEGLRSNFVMAGLILIRP